VRLPCPTFAHTLAGRGCFGGPLRFSPNCYSLALDGIMSRAEFDAIVAELNRCAERHAPNVSRYMGLALIPCAGFVVLPMLIARWNNFRAQLDVTCAQIVKASGRRINLRTVEVVEYHRHRQLHVLLEVMA
jgi:hypothetical protein